MKNMLSSFARSKAFILALAVVFALPAMAHAEFKGKFTLASEAHWGMAVLAPGNYDFSVDSASAPTKIVVRDENGKVAAILISMWSSATTQAKSNKLELETRGGTMFVSAIYLKDADAEIHFSVPKDVVTREAKVPTTTMTAAAQ
ncbi:MAG TPA: hypothetical protein VIW67_16250 [Terriglobales bacterium]|jgi:hypothetical protein